jgi:hypothetical protein
VLALPQEFRQAHSDEARAFLAVLDN